MPLLSAKVFFSKSRHITEKDVKSEIELDLPFYGP